MVAISVSNIPISRIYPQMEKKWVSIREFMQQI